MKGKYKAILALVLLIILVPLTLLLTIAHWLPTLAGIWLPQGTHIAMEASPRIKGGAIVIPDLRYLADKCELANVKDAVLSHPSRWRIHLGELTLNPDCIAKIPASDKHPAAPRTLAEWQAMLPNTWITVDRLNVSPWQQFSGKLHFSMTPSQQSLHYQGSQLTIDAALKGQTLTVSQLKVGLFDGQEPIELKGDFTLPLVPDGLPVVGHIATQLRIPQEPELLDAVLNWHQNQGVLSLTKPSLKEPLLTLPWTLSPTIFEINGGQWHWPFAGLPLRGGVALRFDNWQQGLEKTTISGRMNLLTQGHAGKGNAVLKIGPGRLSMTSSELPLQLTGEAKQDALIFYAVLPGEISGALTNPKLLFRQGALLRSRGRVVDSLNIDEIRWPLAGVSVTQKGVEGRLQAILRAHESQMGNFVLHIDGKARDFLPDDGLWQWRYWGSGAFTPMQARWDVAGKGHWHDSVIELTSLSTGFDKLQYGSMLVEKPRLVLDEPVRWQRDKEHSSFSGSLSLDAQNITFTGGSVLPASTLKFSVNGENLTSFQYKGDLHAGAIGPVRIIGRWDGTRLRGNAWWPEQSLLVFQPLLPPDWKMMLKDGTLYAQVAFSAAAGQGFEAGGHGVVKRGSVWLPDNKINGIDFVLPFRFRDSTWRLGTRVPVMLRIAEVKNQITAQNITADLQGWYPWSEEQPLTLSDVSVDILGGKILMQQLRMPQHDAALLRVHNISSSELVAVVNPKQFTMSGRINGALPLWLNHPQWIVKDGWLTNPGPLTFRMDKDMADAIVANNMAAGSAINWLRYMEISRSWTAINLDNIGVLTMKANLQGTSRVNEKSATLKLNYTHQENLFTLWRSLRFGDNLQTWLEQHVTLPAVRCQNSGKACEDTQ